MIHCIGNSHVFIFSGNRDMIDPWEEKKYTDHYRSFRTYRLGPITAYKFYEKYFNTEVVRILKSIPIEDYVMYVVGEVDCRWHIPNQAIISERKIDDVVEDVCNRLFLAIKETQNMGYEVIMFGAHPSAPLSHDGSDDTPAFGSQSFRNDITKKFNANVEKLCVENNCKFVSIYDYLINQDGTTNLEYYMDYCHLDPAKIQPLLIQGFKRAGIEIEL